MSSNWIADLLEAAPENIRRTCEAHVLELATQIGEDEILMFARSAFPFGTLVVTSDRLIVKLQDGGVKVTPYSDVASFSAFGAKRKLIGGYSETLLNTYFHSGAEHVGQQLGDGWWGIEAGNSILAAHEAFVLGLNDDEQDEYVEEEADNESSSDSIPPVSGPPPGWVSDPNDSNLLRWWDGQSYTEHVKPVGT
jgi:hypothetical protein